MSKFLAISLSVALLGLPATLPAQSAPDGTLSLGRQVAARYDSAFAAVIESARRDTVTFGWLFELARVKAEHIGWAVESRGTLRAVTLVRRNAYLVVVPTDDPAYAMMSTIMEADPGASVRATRVKADTIAVAWAAIFLAFELSHLRDDILGLLPQAAEPEQLARSTRRAYGAEYLAARALRGPVLEQLLDSVLTVADPASARSLAEGILPILQRSFARFDAIIADQKALTEREQQRRVGVYAVALLLRYAERSAVGDAEFAAAVRCIGGCR